MSPSDACESKEIDSECPGSRPCLRSIWGGGEMQSSGPVPPPEPACLRIPRFQDKKKLMVLAITDWVEAGDLAPLPAQVGPAQMGK